MGHPSQKFLTGDSLPTSWIHYRKLIAYFLDPLQETIACFLDPLQKTHCLFLGSNTGDYYLFLGSLYPDNFSLISYFKAEGGHQRIFHLVYNVYEGDIFDI